MADPSTTSVDVCSLPGLTGSCESIIGRYYFNRHAGECKYFTWSGCGGNANNFETFSQCQQACLGINAIQTLSDSDTGPMTGPSHHEDPQFRSYHIIIAFVAIYIVIITLGISYFVTYRRKEPDPVDESEAKDPDNDDSKRSLSESSTHESQRTECIQTQSVSMEYPPPRIPSKKVTAKSTNPFDNLSPTFQSVEFPKSLGRRYSAGIAARKLSKALSPSSKSGRSTFEKHQFLTVMAQSLSPRSLRNKYQLQLDVGEEELDALDGAEMTCVLSEVDGGVELTEYDEQMEANLDAIIAEKERFFETNPITPKMGATAATTMGAPLEKPLSPKTPKRRAMTPSLVRPISPRLTITIEGDSRDGHEYAPGVPVGIGGDGDREATTNGNERRRSTTTNGNERRRSTTVTTLSMAAVDSEFFSGDHEDHDPLEHIVPRSKSRSEHLIEEEMPTGSQMDALQGLMTKLDEDEQILYDRDWQLRANKPQHEYTTVTVEEI